MMQGLDNGVGLDTLASAVNINNILDNSFSLSMELINILIVVNRLIRATISKC